MKTFWFHYNRHASKKAGKPQITVHYNKQCLIVDNIICKVKTWGKINRRQPYFVIKGKCKHLEISEGICYVF